MRLLSVSLNFEGRSALLIGAGKVGRRKLANLLSAGARVRVVEPDPAPWLLELAAEGLIRLEKVFKEEFLDEAPFVFLSAPQDEAACPVIDLAKKKGLWLNSANPGPETNFYLPAVINEGPFRLTVSTGGTSPALAAKVAGDLRSEYRGYGAFCFLMGALRPLILESGLGEAKRREMFKNLAENPALLALLRDGDKDLLRQTVARLVSPLRLPDDFPI
ncbi:MAG: bifunctional precorrin-2 dehydrogenase/sirohydrochlorin ferrochelatase [Deltaproteobacteria bacterium]|nr:bifunctional precorrin-2 dehydrogenase/sirohydrochlorin ferrochelatase [Deltaproteobacteria bacterium]